MGRRRCRSEWVRLTARVTMADYMRLKDIQKKYKFKSIYQIMNYLTYSFLRVADSEHDPITEPMPKEIEEMFDELGSPKIPVRYRKARPVKKSIDQ